MMVPLDTAHRPWLDRAFSIRDVSYWDVSPRLWSIIDLIGVVDG